MTSTGSYSSFDLYLPADTRVPASVLKKINQIQVLEKHYGAKPQPKLISPFCWQFRTLTATVKTEPSSPEGFFIVRPLPFQAEKGRFSEYFPGRGG